MLASRFALTYTDSITLSSFSKSTFPLLLFPAINVYPLQARNMQACMSMSKHACMLTCLYITCTYKHEICIFMYPNKYSYMYHTSNTNGQLRVAFSATKVYFACWLKMGGCMNACTSRHRLYNEKLESKCIASPM